MTPNERPARRRPTVLAAAALAVGFALVPMTAGPAFACSCMAATDQEYASESDAVFVGRVDEAYGSAAATFLVDEVYKGDVHVYARVVDGTPGSGCGSAYVRGQTMLVFAQYRDDEVLDPTGDGFVAPACNGTRSVAGMPITLTAGHAPLSMSDGADDSDGFPLIGWLSYVAVAGLGLMPVALWLRFRGMTRRR
jgi:hypothetical protein